MSLKMPNLNGGNMKKQHSIVLLALIGLFGLSAGAQAQEEGNVVTKIPYEFVAGGKTFPAGTYVISRISPERESTLVIYNHEIPHTSALLEPMSSDGGVDHAGLSFEFVGDTYYLTRVKTSAGVYSLRMPKAANTVSKEKQHDAMASGGEK
jgi:hypothetical protein